MESLLFGAGCSVAFIIGFLFNKKIEIEIYRRGCMDALKAYDALIKEISVEMKKERNQNDSE